MPGPARTRRTAGPSRFAALLAAAPSDKILPLIGHRTPLGMVTGLGFPHRILPEGAMPFSPEGGTYRFLGTISADEFIAVADALTSR